MSDSLQTPQTVAYQAFPSMGFSRQEYWSGLPFPSPGDLPDIYKYISPIYISKCSFSKIDRVVDDLGMQLFKMYLQTSFCSVSIGG